MRNRAKGGRAKIGHGHVSPAHFTGVKGGKRVTRIGKGLTRKQRKAKRGTHINKYAESK